MPQRIAIVGSGMAGLSMAWLAQKAGHEVKVFEASTRRGMDAHRLELDSGWVDVPLRVMSRRGWRHVLRLCELLGQDSFSIDTYVSYTYPDRKTWLRSTKLKLAGFELPFFGHWRYINKENLGVARDLWRMSKELKSDQFLQGDKLVSRKQLEHIELRSFFENGRYSERFWKGFLMPVLATICTCKEEILYKWPALELLELAKDVMVGEDLRRLKHGTRGLVDALSKDLSFNSGSAVCQLKSQSDGQVSISNQRGDQEFFDKVIFATQANQLGFLAEAGFKEELDILSNFDYDRGELSVHTDTSLMPAKRSDWTALNYQTASDFSSSIWTVWVNAVEPSLKHSKHDIFQSWNANPKTDKVIQSVSLERAIVTAKNQQAIARLRQLHRQANRNVFFAGSWAAPGTPLLESALLSAMDIAKILKIPTKMLDIAQVAELNNFSSSSSFAGSHA